MRKWQSSVLTIAAFALGCVSPPEAPVGARRVAVAFQRARLLGDCEAAWQMLTDGRRAQSGHQDFCRRMNGRCPSGDVDVQSSELRGAKAQIAGYRQCHDGSGIEFTVELSPQGDGWAVSAFAEGE